MPKVNINVNSSHSAQDTFAKIKGLFETDPELKKLDPSLTCDFNDQALNGVAKGSRFSANLAVSEQGDQSSVQVDVDLPFILSPLKGQIKSQVEKKLSALLS